MGKISQFIENKRIKGETAQLTFICTHNSRRSQFGQVWAAVAAIYYGLAEGSVVTFSGGTEATACNPRTVAALQRAGLTIAPVSKPEASNPVYEIHLGQSIPPMRLFSKKYADTANPQKGFAAILVCSSADEACPIVFGADKRIYHSYEDPKESDGTDQEQSVYEATIRLIARELFYVFSLLS